MRWINHPTAKGEKGGESITRQGREEQIQGSKRAGQRSGAGPGLDDRPPEEKSRGEERGVLDRVPKVGTHAELEYLWYVPYEDDGRAGQPTSRRVCHLTPDAAECEGAQEATESATNGVWQSARQRDGGRPQQDQRGRDRHQEEMLHHVEREQHMIQRRERRADHSPENHHPGNECRGPAARGRLRKVPSKSSPVPEIEEHRRDDGDRRGNRDGPRRR